MRRVRLVTFGAVLALMTNIAVAAAGETPRFLSTSDFLPDVVTQVDLPEFSAIVNQFVLDSDACVQTLEPDETAEGLYFLEFTEEETQTTVLLETVVVYADAANARAAYELHKATAKGGAKCGSVENQIEGSSVVDYEKLRVPKIGDGAHGVGRRFEGGEPAFAIEFLSGRYACILTTYGNDFSPTTKDLKALAKAAEKQLSSGA